jgi:hypothetical protein
MKFEYESPALLNQLRDLKKRTTKVYFGFPAGNPYAEIARTLSYGYDGEMSYTSPRGNKIVLKDGIPARDFLNDGFIYGLPLINDKIESYWKEYFERGVSSPDFIGQSIIDSIRMWVESDPYIKNAFQVEDDKGYPSVPLIDSGDMIDRYMTFVVTNRL